eukprot:TRINITY_DN30157_c0_g1_i1.p1 TRINITY_DN30157_c0_g1~~TRINITY_DN30157_c0_g1_i1.p1  ORF type:complete len:272 (-),score=66.73 TRINITY_DN30157_c0_g1_i1:65-841(-)
MEAMVPEIVVESDPNLLGDKEAAETTAVAGVGRAKEDPLLGNLTLPAAVIRRIARSAAPGVRFSSEAIGGLHRIAQAYICFATEKAAADLQKENEKAKKGKKSGQSTGKKVLQGDHVMKFLTAEMAPLASKVAKLFPEIMSNEFKPPGVSLLETLHKQEAKQSSSVPEQEASTTEGGPSSPPKRSAAEVGMPDKASSEQVQGQGPAKKAKTSGSKKDQPKQDAPAARSLVSFFGQKSASSTPAAGSADDKAEESLEIC